MLAPRRAASISSSRPGTRGLAGDGLTPHELSDPD
jgi:hypothetical protein